MSQRTSVWILGVALIAAVGIWQSRPAGQGSGGRAGEARWLRAVDAWEGGDYPAALEELRQLMRSPTGPEHLERAALLTGELFVTTDVTSDGRNPAISADGRYVSYETGDSDDPTSHVVQLGDEGVEPVAELRGGTVVFAPSDARVAWIRPAGAAPANPLARAWELARSGEIVIRDLTTGREQVVDAGGLLKTALTWTGDGNGLLFVGSEPGDLTRSDVYLVSAGDAPRRLTSQPGFKTGLQASGDGRAIAYQVTPIPTFRDPASLAAEGGRGGRGGRGGGRGGRGGGPASYGIVDVRSGTTRTITGSDLTLSADGSTIAWLVNDGSTTALLRSPILSDDATEVRRGPERMDAPALSSEGRLLVYQLMTDRDWEIYGTDGSGTHDRITRDIQHDVMPQFLTDTALLVMMGEGRHRRSHVHDLVAGTRTRLFDNNLVRTISPEYVWVPSRNGQRIVIQADRDGDTVSRERGVYVVDLTRRIGMSELEARLQRQLAAESDLRERMRAAYQPVADLARRVVARASVNRVYAYEKALFDFDSKHVTQPGNVKAIEYLEKTYRSFGYEPELQWFDARGNRSANVVARLGGTVDPDLIYVVSSHFDSVAAGPGADDNSSGTAALLEAARILADAPLPATVVFASFTGEEAGLLGSREFVRQAADAGWQVVGALNNDMIGWSGESGRMDNTIRYSNAGIKDLQHGAAFLFTDLITYDAKYYRNTDAAAFYEAWGDIVGGIGSYPVLANPNYHQRTDFLETINHQQVTETAKVTAATLIYLASSPSRLTGLQASALGGGLDLRWTPSPESNIRHYVVAYGPPEDPMRQRVTVTAPSARLPSLPPGTRIAVKAVNARGLEGWDWAGIVVQ